jgi:hypothetical protein
MGTSTEGVVGYPITMEGSGLPAPAYQWQQLITKEINVTVNKTLVKRDHGGYVPLSYTSFLLLKYPELFFTVADILLIVQELFVQRDTVQVEASDHIPTNAMIDSGVLLLMHVSHLGI